MLLKKMKKILLCICALAQCVCMSAQEESDTLTVLMRQLEDIELIRQEMGLDNLPESLREICEIRIQNPEIGLSELGNLMTPPLGKSGVNHRFRKLSSIAQEIREKKSSQGY